MTLPWGETLLAKPLIRLNAAAIPPALADLLGKRRGTLPVLFMPLSISLQQRRWHLMSDVSNPSRRGTVGRL